LIPEIEALNLITDRTQEDVEYWETLRSKIKQNDIGALTPQEYSVWFSGPKGSYTISDLNRVETAVRVLADALLERGYSISVVTKTNWVNADMPTPAEMYRYIQNINTLVQTFKVYPTTPSVPTTVERLSPYYANDIEKILMDIAQILEDMGRTIDLGWAMGIAHTGLYGGF